MLSAASRKAICSPQGRGDEGDAQDFAVDEGRPGEVGCDQDAKENGERGENRHGLHIGVDGHKPDQKDVGDAGKEATPLFHGQELGQRGGPVHEQAEQHCGAVGQGKEAKGEMLHVGALAAQANEQVKEAGGKAKATDRSQGNGEKVHYAYPRATRSTSSSHSALTSARGLAW